VLPPPTDKQVLANCCRADILDDPHNIGAYEILTFALWSNPSERLKAAEAGLRYAPDNYRLNLERGTSLGQPKRYDDAVAALKVTASLQPDDSFPWILMGRLEHERRANDQAILMYRRAQNVKASWLDRIVSKWPADQEADAWGEIGDVFQSLHQCKEASDAWARAASISRRWEEPRTCD
jgi:tetratricopeptide (TPR) repeat protein